MNTSKGMLNLLGVLAGLIALTAIGGGMAMLVGADQFPLEWLRDTPFTSYTIPALILAVVVGGSMLAAALSAFTRRPMTAMLASVAGLFLIGFITIEVLILKQTPPGPTWIEIIYFGLGAVIMGLGWSLQRGSRAQRA